MQNSKQEKKKLKKILKKLNNEVIFEYEVYINSI